MADTQSSLEKTSLCANSYFIVGVIASLILNMAAPNALARTAILERQKMIHDVSNVKNLITACRLFAVDFDGKFPEKLWDLHPEYIDEEKLFKIYNEKTKQFEDYIYIAGRTEKEDNKNLPVIVSPIVRKGMRVVGFNGGHVNEIREPSYQLLLKSEAIIKAQKKNPRLFRLLNPDTADTK